MTPFRLLKSKVCNLLENEKIISPQLQKNAGIPEKCPIKKGVYTMDWYPDLSKVPNFLDGRLRANGTGYVKGRPVLNLVWFTDIQRYAAD